MGPSGGVFFSRLETLVSGSSEAVIFLPRGERMSDSSPWLSSLAEALIPSIGIGSDGGPLSPSLFPLHLPLRALDKVLARASFPAPDCPSSQEGGPNTGSSSPLLSSPGQRAILQNDVMINKRTVCSAMGLLTWAAGRLQLRPTSSVVSGHSIWGPKNDLYISLCVMLRKC